MARWWSEDFDKLLRVEHWTNAAKQARTRCATCSIRLAQRRTATSPTSGRTGTATGSQLAGLPLGEPTVVTGDPSKETFTALFRDGDRLVGALTLNRCADIVKYRALIARRASWDGARTGQGPQRPCRAVKDGLTTHPS